MVIEHLVTRVHIASIYFKYYFLILVTPTNLIVSFYLAVTYFQ